MSSPDDLRDPETGRSNDRAADSNAPHVRRSAGRTVILKAAIPLNRLRPQRRCSVAEEEMYRIAATDLETGPSNESAICNYASA